jgi:DNA-binding MarR family transcriptional regulator
MKASMTRTRTREPPRATYLVKQLERALRTRIDEIVQPHRLTAVLYTALSVVARHEGMSSAQLARRSFVSAQAANELVAALLRLGVIRRKADREGGRAMGIYLTPAGERLLARCDERMDALEDEMFRGVGQKDEARFRELLRSCCDAVREGDGAGRAASGGS